PRSLHLWGRENILMERVFADTGYWIALLNPRDDLHQKASATSRDYSPSQIVTSEMVLTEFLNSFSDYGPRLRQAAARAVASLRENSPIVIVAQTSELFEKALKRYEEMTDKSWSLTDCASFLIMEEERLTSALTHDRHFAQAGFRALLR
ncbi:MAG: PIN domain-containing protein, partial [Candidatus Acidiferrum sp.]